MLKELDRFNVLEFDKLRRKIVKRVGSDGEFVFLPSLNFLYLIGKVEYHAKNDLIELKR